MKLYVQIGCIILIGTLSLSQISTVTAQENKAFYELSLEELMNIPVSVASKTELTQRESPGIISLITEEEIQNSGARDLIDVLQLVPGMFIGLDVRSITGLGSRGVWGHEGKILVLMDGMPLNELCYSNNEFGNHYDVSQIKQIEIVRGPGSALYGGAAELSVINIITKKGADYQGFNVNGTIGRMADEIGRTNVSFGAGTSKNDFSFDIKGFYGKAIRSDARYSDLYGNSYISSDSTDYNPKQLNLGIQYKELKAQYFYDNYTTHSADAFTSASNKIDKYFYSHIADLQYRFKVNDKIHIDPRITYKNQEPWGTNAGDYHILSNQIDGNITTNYDVSEKLNLLLGVGSYRDHINMKTDGKAFDFNGQYGFVETNIKTKVVNISAGFRVEHHSEFGNAFAPRLALTKTFEKLHAKILLSRAFKSPTPGNMFEYTPAGVLQINKNIDLEYTNVFEIEIGYKLSEIMNLQANVYDITINKPIVYEPDINGNDFYRNMDQTGSRGIEVEYKIRDKWGYASINYSHYDEKNKVDFYDAGNHNNALLGAPQHKITLNSSLKIGKNLTINPSLIHKSGTWAIGSIDNAGNGVPKEFDSKVLLNIYCLYRDFLIKGLNAGVGVYDILNQRDDFYQPYKGNHAFIPGPTREIILKISYTFKKQ
ncbi:MAG: TonB-dependent receptor plug domain-containing protein [Bacteroidales bacterium]|nr:TonB-dependent receptor plug domain-containing protein [Bacteroidales bacterium]